MKNSVENVKNSCNIKVFLLAAKGRPRNKVDLSLNNAGNGFGINNLCRWNNRVTVNKKAHKIGQKVALFRSTADYLGASLNSAFFTNRFFGWKWKQAILDKKIDGAKWVLDGAFSEAYSLLVIKK